jgi:hypothetical protein
VNPVSHFVTGQFSFWGMNLVYAGAFKITFLHIEWIYSLVEEVCFVWWSEVFTRRGRKFILLTVSMVSAFGGTRQMEYEFSWFRVAVQHGLKENGCSVTLRKCLCVTGPVRNFVCGNNKVQWKLLCFLLYASNRTPHKLVDPLSDQAVNILKI